jgi:dihydroxyacetone kinase-like predicted kinase
MKIQLGVRGSEDAVNHILIKIDDLVLMNKDNLFLSGEESRIQIGKSIEALLDSLSEDHEISVGEKASDLIERELNMKKGALNKYEKSRRSK